MRLPQGGEWVLVALALLAAAVVAVGLVARRGGRRGRQEASRGVYLARGSRPSPGGTPPSPPSEQVDRPAGWYPDPTGSGRDRWWDGRGWTSVRSSPGTAPGQR